MTYRTANAAQGKKPETIESRQELIGVLRDRVNKFKHIFPEITGDPVNNILLKYFKTFKAGHDRVLALRNAYQHA